MVNFINDSNMYTESGDNRFQKLDRVVTFRLSNADYAILVKVSSSRGVNVRKLIRDSLFTFMDSWRKCEKCRRRS
jgi:predicted DNA binding CopG/RHH family protein